MAISEKQKELDLIKWEKSQLLGNDACGSFNYCVHCNKNIENPCENALNCLNNPQQTTEEPAKKTACKTKAATTKKTTTKSTATKTTKTTKKSTK